MKWSKLLICLTIFICVLVVILYLAVFNVEILTGKKENVIMVTINIYKNSSFQNTSKSQVIIKDRKIINELFEYVENVENITVDRFPTHANSLQFDVDFNLKFSYIDNHFDNIFISKDYVYRFLRTRGNSNDSGYIIGKSEKIWEYIGILSKT